MPTKHLEGPHAYLNSWDAKKIPYYIIRFDKNGKCENPNALSRLLNEAGQHSDIFIFSHGWNNDWASALNRYEGFFSGYMKMRADHGLSMRDGYRPLLVGIFWPSTILAPAPPGKPHAAPHMADAATQPPQHDPQQEQQQREEELAALAEAFDTDEERGQFYELARQDELSDTQTRKLAGLIARVVRYSDADQDAAEEMDVEDILWAWNQLPGEAGFQADAPPHDGGPAIMGNRMGKVFNPIGLIRVATVAIMRDRAGIVGRKGVGPLLESLLRGTAARLHLIGHSYGTKVMLSALCASNAPTRKAHSMLLLQPAVSHLCFADIVPGSQRPGGYRQALSRVTHPIFSTYSSLDNELRMYFHLFPRRRRDKGEYDRAALQMATSTPPSLFAALGGYGPRHAGEDFVPMQAIPNPYQLNSNIPIYGLDGSNGQITGHGKIANNYTWWALYSLVSRP